MVHSQAQPPTTVRQPAVAGQFYASNPDELRQNSQHYLKEAHSNTNIRTKALIAPHA